MLDLIQKDKLDLIIASRSGLTGLGFLKTLLDAHKGKPSIAWPETDKKLLDVDGITADEINASIVSAVESGIFNNDKFLNNSVLTSELMQSIAIFSGGAVPEDILLIDNDVKTATDCVYSALNDMFSSSNTQVSVINQGSLVVADDAFARLWEMYPSRNGRKIGKADAKKFFNSNFKSQKEIDLLERAILNYIDGRGDISARDMKRFMHNDFYLDWVEDAESDGISYEDAVLDCKKNNLFPVSRHYGFGSDELWHKVI